MCDPEPFSLAKRIANLMPSDSNSFKEQGKIIAASMVMNPVAAFVLVPDRCMQLLTEATGYRWPSANLYDLAKTAGLQVAATKEPTVLDLVDEWHHDPALHEFAETVATGFLPK